jgi:hypothetical protein
MTDLQKSARIITLSAEAALAIAAPAVALDDPLPSWVEGDTRTAVVAFVETSRMSRAKTTWNRPT